MKQTLSAYNGNILLYGAGSSGIAFLQDLKKIGVKPVFFVDSDEKKIGKDSEGLEIISPTDVTSRIKGEFIIIVCINTDGKRYCKSFDEALRMGGHHGVYDMLHRAGCRNVIDYTWFRRCYSVFSDEKYNAPSCSDVNLMQENEDPIAEVFEFLGDDLSRETYEKIIRFRLLDDSIEVPTLSQSNQYFEERLYHPRKDAVFVDCGAYNGISAEAFFRMQHDAFDKYFGFEPDPENYEKLIGFKEKQKPEIRGKMVLSDRALWDREEMIHLYPLGGPGSFATTDADTINVKTTTIDMALNGDRATFIKMNIEGSEKQALAGAARTIEIFKPELAIAGYHRTDDLWKIPLQIKKYCPEYKLNLRSYMNHISFVYYAA